jgi:hypothetical protein
MVSIDIIRGPKGFEIHGIPDAKHLVQLSDRRAQRAAHLFLHLADLDFADQCLAEIPKQQEGSIVQQALWRDAIVRYFKCFGSSKARSSLSESKVLKGDAVGLGIFKEFKSLRDKHLVHDENPYTQCIPAAALNDGTKSYKVEKVVTLGVIGDTLTSEGWSNLKLLIAKARQWADAEYHRLCDEISDELEQVPYEELIKLPSPLYSKPKDGDVHRSR